jgi:hypothetical protein
MRPDRTWPRGWIGPAAWGPREARAGDRLPYAAHLDPHTLRLRDGALMQVLVVPGLPFETEDAEHLDHMLAVRDVMLRSALDAGFMLYHHVVRRPSPWRCPRVSRCFLRRAGRHGKISFRAPAFRQRAVPDAGAPPAARQGGLLERLAAG